MPCSIVGTSLSGVFVSVPGTLVLLGLDLLSSDWIFTVDILVAYIILPLYYKMVTSIYKNLLR